MTTESTNEVSAVDESVNADQKQEEISKKTSKSKTNDLTAQFERMAKELKQSILAELKEQTKSREPEVKTDSSNETVSRAEFLDLQKQYRDKVAKEEQMEKANKDKALRESVKDHLMKAGVQTHLLKAAVITLVDADKSVAYNEDKIQFKSLTMGDMDLSEGLDHWLKTDEGKSFLPAKGAIGSGEKMDLKSSKKQPAGLTDKQLLSHLMRR